MYEQFMQLIHETRSRHELTSECFNDCQLAREEERFGELPTSYREFLIQCPTGSFFGDSFILYEGLLSFDDLALSIRNENEQGLVAFGDDQGGTIFCFDTENPNEDGEFPVVEYFYPDYRVQVAESFYEWIMGMIGLYV